MNLDLREVARSLSPVTLQEQLRSRGWNVEHDRQDAQGVVVYRRDGVELDVPVRTDFADYARRVEELVGLLAELEKVKPTELLDTLLQPAGDVLALRVHSEATATGTIPLEDSLRLRQGTKTLLLAAAHSVLSAQAWFPRLSRTEAVELLSSVHEGQSQRGSFTTRFIVPVDPVVGQLSLDDEPYGRRVTKLLLRALDGVRRVRSLGAYDGLLELQKDGVSGNLLGALASMAPPGGTGSLELSMSWARNRRAPEGVVSVVRFSGEALAGLDVAAEAMRSQEKSKGFEVVGYVTRLDREKRERDADGEIVIAPTDGEARELGRVSVQLDANSYADAIQAHKEGRRVRVIGTLQKSGRRWILTEASAFEKQQDDPDEA
ncbi:MAG: hypothetical protein SFV15_17675 [Polyangiaceae bacterium]|nr:hypothetical protein [Polyangiaceae bacterium]